MEPSRCDLGFIAAAFGNQFSDLRKMFGLRLVRPFATLSELTLTVQNQTVSEFGKASSFLD
jgi:hypothetical protein